MTVHSAGLCLDVLEVCEGLLLVEEAELLVLGGRGEEYRVVEVVLDVGDHRDLVLGFRAADADDEADKKSDGVEDVDDASDVRNAEEEDGGNDQALRKPCMRHHRYKRTYISIFISIFMWIFISIFIGIVISIFISIFMRKEKGPIVLVVR